MNGGVWLPGPFEPVDDLALARRTIEAYRPRDEGQRAQRARILAFLDDHPSDAHRRSCLAGHLTASALVLDAGGERALLTHHRKLGRWLQLGGHCDGDACLAGVAWREASEESGIEGLLVLDRPIDLDVHPIPERPGEPEHLHLDVRYLVRAPAQVRLRCSHESLELGWFTPRQAEALDLDPSVRRLFALAFARPGPQGSPLAQPRFSGPGS